MVFNSRVGVKPRERAGTVSDRTGLRLIVIARRWLRWSATAGSH